MTKKAAEFATEADLVAAFCGTIDPARWAHNPTHAPQWVQYHETAGWDLLLAHSTGFQVGIEAKLTLNAKVLEQALPKHCGDGPGPDYRAVLVPEGGLQAHLVAIARHLGITIVRMRGGAYPHANPRLPDEKSLYDLQDWWNWCPAERCALPDYVPDVTGGKAAPVQLSDWKIRAIKLLILLDRRGAVSRRDMKHLGLSPTRWTAAHHGFLSPGAEGYVRNERTPDLRAQHPEVYPQIEADFEKWAPPPALLQSRLVA